jgi:hypothetical protein
VQLSENNDAVLTYISRFLVKNTVCHICKSKLLDEIDTTPFLQHKNVPVSGEQSSEDTILTFFKLVKNESLCFRNISLELHTRQEILKILFDLLSTLPLPNICSLHRDIQKSNLKNLTSQSMPTTCIEIAQKKTQKVPKIKRRDLIFF